MHEPCEPRHFDARLSVVETKVEDLEEEMLRHRERLHKVEGGQAILLQRLDRNAEMIAELNANVPTIARRAAIEAVDLAMDHRDELGHRRWTLRLAAAGAGVGIGGFVSAIIFHFT